MIIIIVELENTDLFITLKSKSSILIYPQELWELKLFFL